MCVESDAAPVNYKTGRDGERKRAKKREKDASSINEFFSFLQSTCDGGNEFDFLCKLNSTDESNVQLGHEFFFSFLFIQLASNSNSMHESVSHWKRKWKERKREREVKREIVHRHTHKIYMKKGPN